MKQATHGDSKEPKEWKTLSEKQTWQFVSDANVDTIKHEHSKDVKKLRW